MMQTGAIAWVDTAEDSKSRKVLAPPGLQVPGGRMRRKRLMKFCAV